MREGRNKTETRRKIIKEDEDGVKMEEQKSRKNKHETRQKIEIQQEVEKKSSRDKKEITVTKRNHRNVDIMKKSLL